MYLGRRISIKASDLPVGALPTRLTQLSWGEVPNIEAQIFEALLVLVGICGNMIEHLTRIDSITDHKSYLTVTALEKDLETWYSALPESLTWRSGDSQTVPLNYLLLQ